MFKKLLLIVTVLLVPNLAQAAAVDLSTIGLLQSSINTAFDSIFQSLSTTCVSWLGGFILLQMVFTQGSGLLQGADWERVWAKFLGGLFWAGICVYIFSNGADFIKSMANYFLDMAAGLTGKPFDPGYPLQVGINSAVGLLNALDKEHSVFASLNPFPSIMMGLVSLVILASCVVISFRIFMIIVETKIVIALSPISFALMGLTALRDQGFVPLKYLIAMAYRVFVLGAILVAMSIFSTSLVSAIQNLPPLSDANVWPAVWAAAIGYSLLGALAWNSNAIASQLASGTSGMTTSDVGGAGAIAAAVGGALGAGVGGAMGAGLGAAKSGIGGGIQAMSDFMKSMGSGVGANNVSDMGSGGLNAAPLKPDAPLNSLGPNAIEKADGPKTEPNPNEFTPPPQQEQGRDKGRDDAREERRQAAAAKKAGGETADVAAGSGATAGIGGTGSSGTGRGVMDHLSEINRHATNGQTHAVQVSMNTHHDL